MANVREEGETFLTKLESVRVKLRDKFSLVHRLLQEREEAMLLQLRKIEDSFRKNSMLLTVQRRELLTTREQLYSSLKGNENRDTLQSMLAPLEDKLGELDERTQALQQENEMSLNNKEEMNDLLILFKELSYIFEPERTTTEYEKNKPILMACKYKPDTNKPGSFKGPTFIAIHPQTEQIYIGDEPNNRIQVFNNSCKFLSSFSINMNNPAGLCFNNDELLVTQYGGHCINVYTSECMFIKSIGNMGNEQLQFKSPSGICAFKHNETVYICEWGNDRVQVLNFDLSFNSFILGLFQPKDIQATRKEIFILDTNNPCIHVYNSENVLLREFISYGNTKAQVSRSSNLCIDKYSNILVTDRSCCCVLIFSSRDGGLIYRFGEKGNDPGEFISPRGIAVNSKGAIVVSSSSPNHCIQFF